jgi:HTH-type transcriptional regulator/antitoxin HigA
MAAKTFVSFFMMDIFVLIIMELTQNAVAQMLGISTSRLSELMHGKMKPSYRLSRELCIKLDISPAIVLGV